jgi:hypothetical protein
MLCSDRNYAEILSLRRLGSCILTDVSYKNNQPTDDNLDPCIKLIYEMLETFLLCKPLHDEGSLAAK